jgi:hypothetical protein
MKDRALILDPVKTIIDLTYKIEKKEKFAFINISRSAINSLLPESEKKPPKYFAKAISRCIEVEDENFMKAIPSEYSMDIENGRYSTLGIDKNKTYYDANTFDHFLSNRKEVIDIFINHYIKDSKNVILSFHDKKTVQKVFGQEQYVVTVPYNNYYDKLDSIVAQVAEFDGGVDSCILDCPLLATAIAPKLWDKVSMSLMDFGKTVSSVRYQTQSQDRERQPRNRSKNFSSRRNEKR